MKKKLFRLVLFLITFSISMGSSAQVDGAAPLLPVDGYVVFNNGDTATGKLKWTLKYVENNPVEIKFTFTDGKVETFKAGEIAGFGCSIHDYESPVQRGFEDYISMPSFKKGVPVFYKRLLGGRITVFLNRSSAQISNSKIETTTDFDGIEFTFSRDGLSIGPTYRTSYTVIESRIRHTNYFVSKNSGPMMKIEKENYASYFDELFGDCDGIKKELEKNPKLSEFKNFMLITEVYNRLCQ